MKTASYYCHENLIKSNYYRMDFTIPVDEKVKRKENEKIDINLDFNRELKKLEHEGYGNTNGSRYIWNSLQKSGKDTRGARDQEEELSRPQHR